MPVDPALATWCDSCDWNVSAPEAPAPETRLERLYAEAGLRISHRLAERLAQDDSSAPRVTASLVAAYAIAGSVYAGLIALAAAGLFALVYWFPNPLAWIGGLCAVLAFLMRPRLGRVPKKGRVERADAPRLYDCVDAVANELETRTADTIIVNASFNASFSIAGLRRRRVLTLGLPLVTMLTPSERIALIAHELSHGRNRDAGRGIVIGGAVRALVEQYRMLKPDDELVARYVGERWVIRRQSQVGGFDFAFHALMWVLSRPVAMVLQLEWHLLLHERQRAEYLADLAAADVAGTEAATALLEKLLLESTFRGVVQRSVRQSTDLFDDLHDAVAAVPERERLRRHRVARLERARLDASHPPTARRIELLQRRRFREAQLDSALAVFDDDLRPRRRELHDRLVDRYRAAVYR